MSKRVALLGLLAALTIGSMSTPAEAWWGGGWYGGVWGGWYLRGGGWRGGWYGWRPLHHGSLYPASYGPYYSGYYAYRPWGRWGCCW
jgi:hypothetical protein